MREKKKKLSNKLNMQQQKRELTPNLLIVISELKEPLLSLTFNILTYEDEVEKQQIAWTIL